MSSSQLGGVGVINALRDTVVIGRAMPPARTTMTRKRFKESGRHVKVLPFEVSAPRKHTAKRFSAD